MCRTKYTYMTLQDEVRMSLQLHMLRLKLLASKRILLILVAVRHSAQQTKTLIERFLYRHTLKTVEMLHWLCSAEGPVPQQWTIPVTVLFFIPTIGHCEIKYRPSNYADPSGCSIASLFIFSLVLILSSELSPQTVVGHVGRSEQDAKFYTREMQQLKLHNI